MSDPAARPSDAPAGGEARNALRGGSWLAAGQAVVYVGQFAVIVVLARLLTPQDYGLATLAFVVIGFGFVFTELGLTAAVVQNPNLQQRDLEAAFWLNAGTGVGVTALVAACSPLIARAFDEPAMLPLLLVASLSFTLSLGVVHTALLERAGRFRALTLIGLLTQGVSWATTITAAVLGAGAISLIIGPLAQTVLATVLLWRATGWRPRGFGTRTAYGHAWRFGRALSGYNLVTAIAMRTDSVVVAQVSGSSALGLYNRAYNLTRVPAEQAYWLLDRVLLPTFSRLQPDPRRLLNAVLDAISFSCLLLFPALFGLAAVAEPMVGGLLGEEWLGAVLLLQVLAVGSAPYIAAAVMRTVFTAAGQTQALFRYGLLQNAATVAAILVGAPWGAEGVATALAVRAWLGLPWLLRRPLALLGVQWTAAMPAVLRVLAASALMAGIVLVVDRRLVELPDLVRLGVGILVGVVAYGAAVLLVARPQLRDAVTLVRHRGARGGGEGQPAGLP